MAGAGKPSLGIRLLALNGAALLGAVAAFVFLPLPIARLINTNLYPIVLAALGTWLSYQIYRSTETGQRARRIWALLTAALGSWTVGDVIWTLNDLVIQASVYPFWDDLFYLMGDLFLVVFFALQIRFLRLALQGWRRVVAAGMILVFTTGAGWFVIAPMLLEPSGDWLEFVVSLLYELLYLPMMIGAFTLTLALYRGVLGKSWTLISIGMFLYVFSNQIYFYAQWRDLYYPNDQATTLSILFDLLYIGSYQILLTGMYLRWSMPFPSIRVEEVLASAPSPRPQEVWVLLSDEGGRTSFVDPRLMKAMGNADVGRFAGERLGAILGVPEDWIQKILRQLTLQEYSGPHPVTLFGRPYALLALREEEPSPVVYWLLTPWGKHGGLSINEKPDLGILLAYAVRGTVPKPSPAELAKAYIQAVFSLLSVLCAHFGGQEVGERFMRQFHPDENVCLEGLSLGHPDAGRTCRDLLQQAQEYALLVVPSDQLRSAMRQLEAGLGEEVLLAAAAAGLRPHLSDH